MRLSRRASIALLSGLLILPLVPSTAFGGVITFGASAGLTPVRQVVGDSTGHLYTVMVRNTGEDGVGIGAVEIKRPSDFWTVLSCPGAPAGWTTQQQADRCRYFSAVGTADNLFPGDPDFPFTLVASTANSVRDVGGKWSVLVSMTDDLDSSASVTIATPMGFGLRTRAFSFQIMDAVVADGPATVGAACPTSNKNADAGSTHTIVLCGRNRTTQTQTLKPKYAGLKGTFIRSHGAFSSGPVAPTATSVVLGNWSNVKITSAVGEDMTVLARVRSAPIRSSAWKTMDGFESATATPVNQAPVSANDFYFTSEGLGLTSSETSGISSTLGNDTDADGNSLQAILLPGTGPLHASSFALYSDGSFDYTPDTGFSGTDAFSYVASDGSLVSNDATVNITVTPTNHAPVAVGDQVATVTTTPINVGSPGVLDNDGDADSDPLTAIFIPLSGPTHASAFQFNIDGSFSYTAVAGYTGGDSFQYKANDGSADSNTVTVSITVNATSGGGGGGGGCLIAC